MLAPNVVDPGAVAALPRAQAGVLGHRRRGRHRPPRRAAAGPRGLVACALAPMIGCFGVAPAGGQAISTATSGRVRRQHGLPPLRPGHDRDVPGVRAGRAVLPRRRPRLPGRRRDRRHRHRDLVRDRIHRARREGQDDRLAARRDGRRRSSPSAMPARSTRRCSTPPPRCCAGSARTTASTRRPPATSSARWSATTSPMSSTRPTRSPAGSRSAGSTELKS